MANVAIFFKYGAYERFGGVFGRATKGNQVIVEKSEQEGESPNQGNSPKEKIRFCDPSIHKPS